MNFFWTRVTCVIALAIVSSPLVATSTADGERGRSPSILSDRMLWNKSSKEQQDVAIKAVAKQMATVFKFIGTSKYSCGGQSHRIASFRHIKSGVKMNLLPAGYFKMGGPGGLPIHTVHIRKPFFLARFELSQMEWDKVGVKTRRRTAGKGLPVEGATWNDAQSWLKKMGGGLRLPSDAEWEYACRSGTTTIYPWGDEMDKSYCWYMRTTAGEIRPVKLHIGKANAFGLVDMLGNVTEWCQDCFIFDHKAGPVNEIAMFDKRWTHARVVRGGNASSWEGKISSSFRYGLHSDGGGGPSFEVGGVRLAHSLDITKSSVGK